MLDTEENPEFGLLDNRTPEALNNRATFLPGGIDFLGFVRESSTPIVYGLSRPSMPSTGSPVQSALFDSTINTTISNFSANLSAEMKESTLAFESNDLDDAHSRNSLAYFASKNQEEKNYLDKMLEKIERKMEENTIKRRRLSYEWEQRNN
jgi:hypothetical protein